MVHIIWDVHRIERNGEANALRSFGIEIADSMEMTAELLRWEGWVTLNPKTTLLVFPGNGAERVLELLPKEWLGDWNWARGFAKRIWEHGSDPVYYANRIYPHRMLMGITDVVILDDAIAGGGTCAKVRQENEIWIPGARWSALTWIKQRKAWLKGNWRHVVAALKVGDKDKKSPMISLSTLLEKPEIREAHLGRYYSPEAAAQIRPILLGLIEQHQPAEVVE